MVAKQIAKGLLKSLCLYSTLSKVSNWSPYIFYVSFVCLFDLIFYVPSTIFQFNRDGSSWVEPVLSYDKCVLLKDHNTVTPVRLDPAAPQSQVKHSTIEPLRSQYVSFESKIRLYKIHAFINHPRPCQNSAGHFI